MRSVQPVGMISPSLQSALFCNLHLSSINAWTQVKTAERCLKTFQQEVKFRNAFYCISWPQFRDLKTFMKISWLLSLVLVISVHSTYSGTAYSWVTISAGCTDESQDKWLLVTFKCHGQDLNQQVWCAKSQVVLPSISLSLLNPFLIFL